MLAGLRKPTLRSAARASVAAVYVAAAALFFADYYRMVRAARVGEMVDFTAAVIWLAVLALPVAMIIGRLWAIAMPLAVFPIAVVGWVISSFDETYSADATERGGVLGADWLGLAALIAVYAIPAAALGVGLREVGRRLERRNRS